MKNIGIKYLLRIATLVPTMLVALLFALFYNGLFNALDYFPLEGSSQSLLVKRYQMAIVTIFITLFGLLLSLTMHYFLSRRIYLPIIRLRRSMKQILNDVFETEIKTTSSGDIGVIERGVAHLQQHYLNSLRDLNQNIETATADLQQSLELLEEKNIQLSLDRKKSEEKSRQKTEFIANMSHEIRTPMNGVIGFSNVLLETKLDSLQLDYVSTIKSSAQDLLTVINDILDFTKIDAGKLQLDCIPLDIRTAIDEVLTLAAPNAHRKGVDLIPITASEVPKTVLGDPLRIKQIISNLITNAIKFTENGHVVIRTSLESEDPTSYTLALSVSDTGIGISPDDQGKLFTAFNQADTSITRRYGGSGLGLVLCKKLCETMQGRISFTSTVGKGSNFTALIKLEKLKAYESDKAQAPRYTHKKALCYDANPLHLEALTSALGFCDIPCVAVKTLKKLDSALKTHKDCTLVFITLGEGEEPTLTAFLTKHPDLICVLVSRWPINHYQALGAKAVLYHPINVAKLQNTLTSLQGPRTNPTDPALEHLRERLRALHPTLLVAEDNRVNQMLLGSLLSTLTETVFVGDGEAVVNACKERKFDLLILDLHMPKKNGLEATELIRLDSKINKNTPIILLSANDNELAGIDLKKAGIDNYLAKPVDEKQLLQQILRITDKAQHSAIDWPMCIQKVSGNQALAEEYLAKFVEELHNERAEFLELSRQKNNRALGELAHKLHGACCFCGVPFLQKKVMQLETMAPQVSAFDELLPLFAEVIQCIDDVINEYNNKYAVSNKPKRKDT